MKSVLIRGVPLKMQQDGWWLSTAPEPRRKTGTPQAHAMGQLGLLAVMVALGDILMWRVVPGLSLAVFGALCVAAGLAMWPRKLTRRQVFLACAGTVLCLLPLVELVQPLSLLVAMAGLPVTLAAIAGHRAAGSIRFWWAAPWFSLRDVAQLRVQPQAGFWARFVRVWALPLAVGGLFAGLLISANPVLDGFAQRLGRMEVAVPDATRLSLWALLAVLVWPVLQLARFAPSLAPAPRPVAFGPWRGARWINAEAILRSLVLFNLMFAVQNSMDMAVMIGGAALPEGMSFAQYAHRGAYPLLALALLSGGFALLARPFIVAAPVLRALLLIWVAQTIWLTFSSVLRLDLYVDAYGLTRLRVAAAIWMGLVLAGLALILAQIAQARSNGWLMQRVGALGCGVLYLCCFVNIDGAIARHNLSGAAELDRSYLCRLSEGAAPAITQAQGPHWCSHYRVSATDVFAPRDWREWGFRNARVRHSLAGMTDLATQP